MLIANNWGNLASVIGLIVSLIGLTLTVWFARQARNSARAAEAASLETRNAIRKTLTLVDLERAIALMQRLKALHQAQRWEVSLDLYQLVRSLLADIAGRYPRGTDQNYTSLREAIVQIKVMEDNVDRAIRSNSVPTGAQNFNRQLNAIQTNLEEIVSLSLFQPHTGG